MKQFLVILTCQTIPIWVETVYANNPPELERLNESLGMFGDGLFVKEITNTNIRNLNYV